MTRFRWGNPYESPAGTFNGDRERLQEAVRGLGLRVLVYVRRGLRRVARRTPREASQ